MQNSQHNGVQPLDLADTTENGRREGGWEGKREEKREKEREGEREKRKREKRIIIDHNKHRPT